MTAMEPICAMLDEGSADEGAYLAAHAQAMEAVNDPDQTWSARLLSVQRESRQSFSEFGLGLARAPINEFNR